jgi:hypothetical protein
MRRDKGEVVNEDLCPICGSTLQEVQFVGEEKSFEFALKSGLSDFLDERGVPRFIISVKKGGD